MTQLGPKTCVPACVRHGFFKEASATCRIFLSFYLRVFVMKLNIFFSIIQVAFKGHVQNFESQLVIHSFF